MLPVSTSAQPVSTGGSEEDVDDVSRLDLSAALAGSSQAAKSDAPVQQAAPPSASPVHIPFTGTAANRSSRQPPTPQAAAAATVSTPSTYRSRLPPPPPVFKALTCKPQASVLQSSNRATGQSANQSPWSPALLKGVSRQANTLSKGQPAGSVPTFLRPPISQFHPAKPGFAQSSAGSQHQEQTSTSSRDAAGRYSSADLSNGPVVSPMLSPSAAAHSADVHSDAASEATTSPGAQTASQLSLLDERQLIPGVSTGRTEKGFAHTEIFQALAKERGASLADSPAKPEVDDLYSPFCFAIPIMLQLPCHTCFPASAIPAKPYPQKLSSSCMPAKADVTGQSHCSQPAHQLHAASVSICCWCSFL